MLLIWQNIYPFKYLDFLLLRRKKSDLNVLEIDWINFFEKKLFTLLLGIS